jgi:hypothetical protein
MDGKEWKYRSGGSTWSDRFPLPLHNTWINEKECSRKVRHGIRSYACTWSQLKNKWKKSEPIILANYVRVLKGYGVPETILRPINMSSFCCFCKIACEFNAKWVDKSSLPDKRVVKTDRDGIIDKKPKHPALDEYSEVLHHLFFTLILL